MAITVHLSEILKERGMTALLLLDLSGRAGPPGATRDRAQDRFVGFHLVYEPAPSREERNIEDEHWVEYGTQTLDAGPCGSVPSAEGPCRGGAGGMGPCTLNGHGSSYAGGGDFGFNQTRSETERINGDVTQQSTFEFSVDVQMIPPVGRRLHPAVQPGPAAPPGGHPHRRGGHGPGRGLDPPWAEVRPIYPGGEAQLRWDLDLRSVPRGPTGRTTPLLHRLVSGHSGDGRPGDE